MFLFGVSSVYTISFVGTISGQEVIIGLIGPWLIPWRELKSNRILYGITLGVLAWLIIQIVTDVYRDIPLNDLAKGSARIVFFILGLYFLWRCVATDVRRAGAYLLGTASAGIASYFLFPSEMSFSDPWKWHFGPAVMSVIFSALCFFRVRSVWMWAVGLLLIGVANALFNFRSLAGINVAVGGFILFNSFILRMPLWFRSCLAVGGAILILFIYSITASTGLLGEQARLKYESQLREGGTFLTVMSGGRSEYRASTKAISDSPIIGFGSWAQRPEYIMYALDEEKFTSDSYAFKQMLSNGYIPTHSMLLGTWVDAGIIPGLLWMYLWFFIIRCLLTNRIGLSEFGPLSAIMAVGLLWSILFSPFGSSNRTAAAFCIVVVVRHYLLSRRAVELPVYPISSTALSG